MPAWAAPTVTNVTTAGQTTAAIYQNVKDRLAGQASPSAGISQGTSQGGFFNLGTVRDQYGNLAEVLYDPTGNIFYTVAR